MDSNPSKLSFIPKSPLLSDDALRARSRPWSMFGVFASIIFLVIFGAYVGLYFYNDVLASRIESLTAKVNEVREGFDNMEVKQARAFYARAELVRSLLDDHIIVNPVFDFLEANTVATIFYTNLDFKRDDADNSLPIVTITGEAPSYASLAYQADIFRERDELTSFFVKDVTLTNVGSVTFSLEMTFVPDYLSYTKQYAAHTATSSAEVSAVLYEEAPLSEDENIEILDPALDGDAALATTTESVGTQSPEITCVEPLVRIVGNDGSVSCGEQTSVSTPQAESWLASFWSKLKFW